MILLSQVSPGMNLSGTLLYFNQIIYSDSKLCDEFVLGVYTVESANKIMALRVIEGEDNARILQMTASAELPSPVWTTICNSNFGWDGTFKYVRTLALPNIMSPIPELPPNESAFVSWIPYVNYIDILTSEIDRPMLHYTDINPNSEASLVYDRLLSEIKIGDDLTDKVIILDQSIEFDSFEGEAVTIGDPIPYLPENSTWYIKYSLCNTDPNKHDIITSGLRKEDPTVLFNDGLWIKNYLDLTPKETYEKFVVNQLPPVGTPALYLDAAFICSKVPKLTSSSTIEILREAARRMHIPEPTSVEIIPTDLTTSDAQNSMLLLTSLNQTLKSVAIFAPWPQMLREIRFMAVRDSEHYYNEVLRGFDLEKICPSYDGIVSPFIYDTDRKYAIPQVFEKEFYDLTLGNTVDTPMDQMVYRVVGNHICFSADINGMVTFLYKTKYVVKSISGEWGETTAADKDICIFDPELCVLGTIVSFKASIGQDPAIENALFDKYMEHLKGIVGMPSTTPINYQGV